VAAFTSAGSSWVTTGGNTTVTATPTLDDLIIVIAGTSGLAGGTTTVTDNSSDGFGTTPGYTQIDVDRTGFSTTGVLTMWVRNRLIKSGTSTIFTAAQVGSTGGGLQVCRVSGMSIVGLGAVRGAGGQSTITAATTPAPVLLRRVGTTFSGTQAALTANLCIGVVMNGSNPATMTAPASWTESVDLGYITPTTGMETAFRNSGETGSTITWGSTTATAGASMAIELDISVPLLGYVNPAGGKGAAGMVPGVGAKNVIQQGAVGRGATWMKGGWRRGRSGILVPELAW
jgi:hypothetical protein